MARKIFFSNPDDLVERYLSGVSENEISKSLGVCRGVVRRVLLEAGITPRTQSASESVKWSRMPAEQRARQVKAAHDAARGRKRSWEELCKAAESRNGNISYNVSKGEKVLSDWLRDLGLEVVQNLAVGPYNCDIGTGPVTVEVWGGGWHPKVGEVERTKYILNRGYDVLIITIDEQRFPLSRAVCEHILALLDLSSRPPTEPRQYWMIRGDGELIFKRFNDDNISLVPPFTSSRDAANGQYKRIPR